MKSKILAFTLISMFATSSHALRCGRSIVQVGDHEKEVHQKCGTPLSHEEIGYIDKVKSNNRITVLKIEESHYKISNRIYQLRFEGNILVKIDKIE